MFNIHLRGVDYRVVFEHEERDITYGVSHVTTCYLIKRKNKVVVDVGRSFCSIRDQFNKNKERKVALERLANSEDFNFPREERREIWAAYFAARNGNQE